MRRSIGALTIVAVSMCGCTSGDFASEPGADGLGPSPVASSAGVYPGYQNASTQGIAAKNANPSDFSGRVLWYNESTRLVACWRLNSGGDIADAVPIATTTTSDWTIKGSGDFNGDGQPDILWQHKTTRQLGIWLLNGNTVIGGASLPTPSAGWDLIGVADADGDNAPNLFWSQPSTGLAAYWKMAGTSVTGSQTVPSAGSNFQLNLVGNMPGRPAMPVWKQTDGTNIKMQLDSTFRYFMGTELSNSLAAIGDLDGDGQPELVTQKLGSLDLNQQNFFRVTVPISTETLGLENLKLIGTAKSADWKFSGLLGSIRSTYQNQQVQGGLSSGAVYDATRQRVYLPSKTLPQIELYDVRQRKMLAPLVVNAVPTGLCLSADNSELLAWNGGTEISRVDLATGVTRQIPVPQPSSGQRKVVRLAWASDNHCLVVTDHAETSYLWNLDLGTESWASFADGGTVQDASTTLALSPDHSTIVGCHYRDRSLDNAFRYANGVVTTLKGPQTIEELLADGQMVYRNTVYSPQGVWNLDTAIIGSGRSGLTKPTGSKHFTQLTVPPDKVVGRSLFQPSLQTRYQYPAQLSLVDLERNRLDCVRSLPKENDPSNLLIGLVTVSTREFVTYDKDRIIHINLPENLPPVVDPKRLQAPVGSSAEILLQAHDPEGQPLTYTLENANSDLQLDATTGRLTFRPTTDYPQEKAVNVLVSDGANESKLKLTLETATSTATWWLFPNTSESDKLLVDSARHTVYLSSGSRRQILRYDYLTRQELPPIAVPGAPSGMDLSADGRTLLVCETLSSNLASVDLTLASPTVTRRYSISGAGDRVSYAQDSVAVTTTAKALVGTLEQLSGNPSAAQTPQELDLATGIVTPRSDLTQTHRATIQSSPTHDAVVVPFGANSFVSLNAQLTGALPTPVSTNYYSSQAFYSSDSLSIIVTPALARFQVGSTSNATGNSSYQGACYWNGGPTLLQTQSPGTFGVVDSTTMQTLSTITVPATKSGPVAQSADDTYRFFQTDRGLVIFQTP